LFGTITDNNFVDCFSFKIGNLQFYPRIWTSEDVWNSVPHEIQHTKQMRMLGLCIPFIGVWIGYIIFMFLYFLCLPFYFNWFRYVFERQAVVADVFYLWSTDQITKDEVLPELIYGANMISSKYHGYAWRSESAKKSYIMKYNEKVLDSNFPVSKIMDAWIEVG
jgi:hypothetical protein